MLIISWNANSIRAHCHQLKLFIDNANIKPQIICILETWLKKHSNFTIPGYNMESKCRDEGRGGGVATFIKEGIAYSRCSELEEEGVEAVITAIHTDQRDPIYIANIYIPPHANIIKEELQEIFQLNKVLICGDLNAKSRLLGSPVNDARGMLIQEMLEDHNLTVLNTGEGTRLNHDGKYSHLDISLTSNTLAINSNWTIIDDDEWGSDHLPTMILINETPHEEEGQAQKYNLKKADWEKYKETCKLEINKNQPTYP